MCARIVRRGRLHSPSQSIQVQSERKTGVGKWAGFARSESLEAVWDGWTPLDIPADKFAERHQETRELRYDDVPEGMVISGIGNPKTGEVKVLTREASDAEMSIFGHDRMPVLIKARFS